MSDAAAILALEERRRIGMLARDCQALGELLAEDLRYVHSTGGADTRDSLLAKLAGGLMVYRQLAFERLSVQQTPDAAVVAGEMQAQVQRGDVLRDIASCYVAVWLRRDAVWRLAAFQATPLPR